MSGWAVGDPVTVMPLDWTAPAELLIRLPDGLPLRHAALVEPTAVAVYDVRLADARAGCRRGIGLAMAQALARAGADIVGVSASLEPRR